MTSFAPVAGMIGGILINLSAVLLMLTIGRIAGRGQLVGMVVTIVWRDKMRPMNAVRQSSRG